MNLLQILLVLVLVGCLVGAIQRYAPIPPFWKGAATLVAIAFTVVWLLEVFGLVNATGVLGGPPLFGHVRHG